MGLIPTEVLGERHCVLNSNKADIIVTFFFQLILIHDYNNNNKNYLQH